MNWSIIKNEAQYNTALARLEEIFDSSKGSANAEEAELLTFLIEKYEEQKFPLPEPDPIEAIKFLMEQTSLKQSDFIGVLGNKASVSRILNKKRALTIDMVRKLHARFKIPYDVLLKQYSTI